MEFTICNNCVSMHVNDKRIATEECCVAHRVPETSVLHIDDAVYTKKTWACARSNYSSEDQRRIDDAWTEFDAIITKRNLKP